jgi:prolipoprotein diacylglyceryltransferase
MTIPLRLQLGPAVLEAHFVFELLAYFLGYRYYVALRRREGDAVGDDARLWIVVGAILGAAIGSKLLGLLEHPRLLSLSRDNLAYLFAAKTIVGGLLGGVIGVEAAKLALGVTRSTGDLFCFPIILGMMVGRLGCFFAGVDDGTWGDATSLPVGIDGGDGVPRHPMPLYEIAMLGAIWLALARAKRDAALPGGALFRMFMTAYLAWRFLAEFFKPVETIAPLGLSAIQIACLLGLAYYARAFRIATARKVA